MKSFYHLLFYKILKFSSVIREKSNAAFISGILIGFLGVFALMHVVYLLNCFNRVPKWLYVTLFVINIIINVYYFMRNKKYEIIDSEMNSKKLPFLCHACVYLFLCWSIIGAFL